MRNHRPRGFTLLELMIAVAVIGLLASVAIPLFQNMQLRAKQAERTVILTAIVRSIDELWVRDGRFPLDGGGGITWLLLLAENPDVTPTSMRRGWRYSTVNATDHWNRLALQVEGGVLYSYGGWAVSTSTQRTYVVYARGDLDGDTVVNSYQKQYTWVNGIRQTYAGGNATCADCSIATETNPDTW